jgi:hypothetical protein
MPGKRSFLKQRLPATHAEARGVGVARYFERSNWLAGQVLQGDLHGLWHVVLCLAALLMLATPAEAIQLVTPEEAALPPSHTPDLVRRGGPTRRPSIVIVSPPPEAGVVQSPLNLRVKLRAFGGAKIDPDSIVVTYEKSPLVDITQRITAFISADGIDVPDARVPPGLHEFRIQAKDNEGRLGIMDFSFQVGQ